MLFNLMLFNFYFNLFSNNLIDFYYLKIRIIIKKSKFLNIYINIYII